MNKGGGAWNKHDLHLHGNIVHLLDRSVEEAFLK